MQALRFRFIMYMIESNIFFQLFSKAVTFFPAEASVKQTTQGEVLPIERDFAMQSLIRVGVEGYRLEPERAAKLLQIIFVRLSLPGDKRREKPIPP